MVITSLADDIFFTRDFSPDNGAVEDACLEGLVWNVNSVPWGPFRASDRVL